MAETFDYLATLNYNKISRPLKFIPNNIPVRTRTAINDLQTFNDRK